MTPRAPSLAPEARRAALVDAALPLLLAKGPSVSTREIADAAGVAEGTIFRAFETKEHLVEAAVASAFDTGALTATLRGVDRGLPLEARLVATVAALQEHVERAVALMVALMGGGHRPGRGRVGHPHLDDGAVEAEIGAIIGADARSLSRDVREVAGYLRMVTFASSHPLFAAYRMTPAAIVELVLHGVADQAGMADRAPRPSRGRKGG